MENNKVFDLIIDFVNAIKSAENGIVSNDGERTYKICGPKYLLGQIIRQYELPPEQYYVSSSAKALWETVSKDDMWKYTYRHYVKCENEKPVMIFEYTGNQNKPSREREVSKGDGFVFRDVFHDEHMIPVSLIIDKLISLPELNYDNVKNILDSIYICRLLKFEDRNLPVKYKRPFDLQEVIKMYNKAGIEIEERR